MRAAAFLAAASLAACAAQPSLGQALYTLQRGHIDLARGPDGNSVILDAPAGLIVIDTGRHPEHVATILDHARKAGKPIAVIVNTHWHLDHTTGNRDVRLAHPAAEVVATGAGEGALSGFLAPGIAATRRTVADATANPAERAAAERRLAAIEDRRSFLPRVPVTHDETRRIAGREMELHVAPAAVTEADLWLIDPQERLAIVGDLVVAQAPFFDTGCEEGWSRALDAIALAEWDTLIPGHGEPMDRAAFARWRTAFDRFIECGRSDAASSTCGSRWLADAQGFYRDDQREDVQQLIAYYVDRVLRAPESERMAYCRSGS